MIRPLRSLAMAALILSAATVAVRADGPDPASAPDGAVGLTRIVKIQHRNADSVRETIETHLSQAYTPGELARYSITVDAKTNSLIFRAASSRAVWLNDALTIIRDLDVPAAQATTVIALIGRAEPDGRRMNALETEIARQNGWPSATTLGLTRFLAANEVSVMTPLDSGPLGTLLLTAQVGVLDPASRRVTFSAIGLERAPIGGGPMSEPRRSARDEGPERVDEESGFYSEENMFETYRGNETLISLSNVTLKGGEPLALGPFPVGENGEQAVLAMQSEFTEVPAPLATNVLDATRDMPASTPIPTSRGGRGAEGVAADDRETTTPRRTTTTSTRTPRATPAATATTTPRAPKGS